MPKFHLFKERDTFLLLSELTIYTFTFEDKNFFYIIEFIKFSALFYT